jgi:hypothetical protein
VAEPGEDGRLQWDLLIVDEAHNLAPANSGDDSDLSKMLQNISPWFEHRLFLTATPHNGHTRCFSGLLEALDPVRFTRKSTLNATDRARVGEAVIRRLKSHINASYSPPRFSERYIEGVKLATLSRAERNLGNAFHDLRKAIRTGAAQASPTDRVASGFALEVLHKRLLSGPWAFGQSWLNLMAGMTSEERVSALSVKRAKDAEEQDTEDDQERRSRQQHTARTVGAWMRSFQEFAASEIEAVSKAIAACGVRDGKPATTVRADARFDALTKLIDEKIRDGSGWKSDERIFTEYLDTLDSLKLRLEKHYTIKEDNGVV